MRIPRMPRLREAGNLMHFRDLAKRRGHASQPSLIFPMVPVRGSSKGAGTPLQYISVNLQVQPLRLHTQIPANATKVPLQPAWPK